MYAEEYRTERKAREMAKLRKAGSDVGRSEVAPVVALMVQDGREMAARARAAAEERKQRGSKWTRNAPSSCIAASVGSHSRPGCESNRHHQKTAVLPHAHERRRN